MTQNETEQKPARMHPVDRQIIVANAVLLLVMFIGAFAFEMLNWFSLGLGFWTGGFFIVAIQMYLGKDDPFRSKPSDEGAGGGA